MQLQSWCRVIFRVRLSMFHKKFKNRILETIAKRKNKHLYYNSFQGISNLNISEVGNI